MVTSGSGEIIPTAKLAWRRYSIFTTHDIEVRISQLSTHPGLRADTAAAFPGLDVGALALGKQAEGEWVKEGKNEWHFDPETFKKMAVLKAKGKVTLINDCTRERMRVFRAAQNGLAEHRRRLEAEVEEPKQLTARQREQQTWQAKRRKEREEAHADRMAAARRR